MGGVSAADDEEEDDCDAAAESQTVTAAEERLGEADGGDGGDADDGGDEGDETGVEAGGVPAADGRQKGSRMQDVAQPSFL